MRATRGTNSVPLNAWGRPKDIIKLRQTSMDLTGSKALCFDRLHMDSSFDRATGNVLTTAIWMKHHWIRVWRYEYVDGDEGWRREDVS